MLKITLPFILLPVLVTLLACGGSSSTSTSTETNSESFANANAEANSAEVTQTATENQSSSEGGNGTSTSTGTDSETSTGTQLLAGVALPDISHVNQFGWVSVDEYSDAVELSASFFSFDDEITPTEELVALILPPLDTCSIVKQSVAALDPTSFGIPLDISFQVISAGEVLVFSGEQGTVASLLEQTQFGFKFYAVEPGVTLTPPWGANITLSIPGEQFPAFSHAAVPNVNALVGNALLADAPVAVDHRFTWTGDNDPFSRVIIQLEGVDIEQDAVNIECDALDDDEFNLPLETAAALAEDQPLIFKHMKREVFSVATEGGSALLVYHTKHP